RRADLYRVVADDVDAVAGRQALLELGHRVRHGIDDRDRVRAGLFADRESDRGNAIAMRGGLGFFLGVFELRDVADADRVVALLAHDDVADLLRLDGAAFDAERRVLRAHLELTAGNVDVRAGDCSLDLERGHAG